MEELFVKMRYIAYFLGALLLLIYSQCHSFGYTLEAELNHEYIKEAVGLKESDKERRAREEEEKFWDSKIAMAIEYSAWLCEKREKEREAESSTYKQD